MYELLRDSIWTFVGAVLALAAIGATFLVYALQRPRKRLLIERVACIPLVTIGANKIDGLEVRLNGESLESASVVVVRITNNGNQSIPAADFERQITIRFEERAVVLYAETSDSTPQDLTVATNLSGRELQIEKCLLNPGDSFLCRALVRDSKGSYDPVARVVGMKNIETSRSDSVFRPVTQLLCIMVICIAFALSPSPKSVSPSEVRPEEIPYIIAALLALATLLTLTLYDLRLMQRALRDRIKIITSSD